LDRGCRHLHENYHFKGLWGGRITLVVTLVATISRQLRSRHNGMICFSYTRTLRYGPEAGSSRALNAGNYRDFPEAPLRLREENQNIDHRD
jgi:fructose-1,6-bisphosphatase